MWVWLDDIRPMPEAYDIHIKTAPECIELLKTNRVMFISFDHDLGTEEAGTGYDVAKFIEESAFNGVLKPLDYKVHSANPVGEKNIHDALANASRFWSRK